MAVSDNADLKDDKELAERPSPGKLQVYVQNSLGISQEGRVYISAWEKINQLSPMKRAIVLSEILGKPKGLE